MRVLGTCVIRRKLRFTHAAEREARSQDLRACFFDRIGCSLFGLMLRRLLSILGLRRRRKLDELAKLLGLSSQQLVDFTPRYRAATIPKRSGGKRILHIPDGPTKALQRKLLRRVLAKLAAHPAATAFERGRSIVHNAAPHVGSAVIIKLDVVDFFPSTRKERLHDYFQRIGWAADAATVLTRLVTHEGGLPQGAPTSPRLSNLVNYGLDVRLAKLAWRRGAVYTRYADDITFSRARDAGVRSRGVVDSATRILNAHGYRVHQKKKLQIRRRRQRQSVTGLVVNEKVNLPREVRRRLRAVEHHLQMGRAATMTAAQLAGWRAFQEMIEHQRS